MARARAQLREYMHMQAYTCTYHNLAVVIKYTVCTCHRGNSAECNNDSSYSGPLLVANYIWYCMKWVHVEKTMFSFLSCFGQPHKWKYITQMFFVHGQITWRLYLAVGNKLSAWRLYKLPAKLKINEYVYMHACKHPLPPPATVYLSLSLSRSKS